MTAAQLARTESPVLRLLRALAAGHAEALQGQGRWAEAREYWETRVKMLDDELRRRVAGRG